MTTLEKKLDFLRGSENKFFVDIGASNDPIHSQTESLLELGWSGVMFECDPNKYVGLRKRMEGKNVKVVFQKATPKNIVDLFIANEVPPSFYLSIDIDGYDIFVLDEILKNYNPYLVISETNEKIPPPIKFTVTYDDEYWWDSSHFYGYSISYLADVLKKHNYKIDSLDWNNAIIVPGEQEIEIEKIYLDGYLNREDRKKMFPWNHDFEPIYSMDYQDKIKFIKEKFNSRKNFTLE
jgi:hypothetical protein